jgi:DNA-directed RNA polymerase subunit F
MADEEIVEKTPLEKSQDIISQLKEMEHYARSNIERLTAQWLQIDDELKQKDIAKQVEGLLAQQNTMQEALAATIADYEALCTSLEPKT